MYTVENGIEERANAELGKPTNLGVSGMGKQSILDKQNLKNLQIKLSSCSLPARQACDPNFDPPFDLDLVIALWNNSRKLEP